MNVLMLSQVAGYLGRGSTARYQALLCCSGTIGYAAFRRFLESMQGNAIYQHFSLIGYNKEYDTILLITNVDLRDDDAPPPTTAAVAVLEPPSVVVAATCEKHATADELVASQTSNDVDHNYVGDDEPFSFLITPSYLTTVDGREMLLQLLASRTRIAVFGSVPKLPCGFLRKSTALKIVDLSGLSDTSDLSSSFLCGCTSMRTLHWSSAMLHISDFPYGCLKECRSITSIDLTPFRNVTKILGGFLEGCSSLTSIDLSPLGTNITGISWNFLRGCSGLLSINFHTMGANVTAISSGFLGNCSNLTEVDLSSFVVLKKDELPYECFVGCSRLQLIKYPPNVNVCKYQEARCFWVKQNSEYDRDTD